MRARIRRQDLPHSNPSSNSDSRPLGSAGTGLWSGLLVLLAFPWAVHALVVGASSVGLHPLSSRIASGSILVLSAALSVLIAQAGSKRAERARDEALRVAREVRAGGAVRVSAAAGGCMKPPVGRRLPSPTPPEADAVHANVIEMRNRRIASRG